MDAYDAIRSPRAYSHGRTAGFACQEILRNRGTQFDPAVVDIFLQSQDEIEEIGRWPS